MLLTSGITEIYCMSAQTLFYCFCIDNNQNDKQGAMFARGKLAQFILNCEQKKADSNRENELYQFRIH